MTNAIALHSTPMSEGAPMTSADRGDAAEKRRDGPSGHDAGGESGEGRSPCRCDFHRNMTADQAWSTLP